MQHAGRLAKAAGRAAVPVAAGVVATTSQPVAQADAYAGDVLSRRRIQDAWEFADLSDKEVLFKPEEIDEALACLTGRPQAPSPSAVIEELDSDISSDGTADAVIERDMRYYAASSSASSSSSAAGLPLDMQDLCTLAGRLLKSPGVQQEILKAACCDPEVFEILASKTDLPEYLESAGFAARGLLTSPAADSASAAAAAANIITHDDGTAASAATAPSVLEQLQAKLNEGVAKLGEGVESVGNAVVKLGRWMRAQLTGEEFAADAEAEKGQAGRNKAAGVLTAVTIVMVAIVAVVMMRRPPKVRASLLARLFRRA